jgi:hypothetical protein
MDQEARLGSWVTDPAAHLSCPFTRASCEGSVEDAVADVGGERRGPDGQDLQLQRRDAVEKAFTCAEGERCDVGAQLIDEPAARYWLTVAAPPAMATSRSPAAVRACSKAAWMPSVTNVKVSRPASSAGRGGGG